MADILAERERRAQVYYGATRMEAQLCEGEDAITSAVVVVGMAVLVVVALRHLRPASEQEPT